MERRRVHVVGTSGSGKTVFAARLIAEFRARGLSVGSVKVTPDRYPIDKRGSDSHTHATAGAQPSAFACAEGVALQLYKTFTDRSELYAAIAPLYAGCDVVVVEGDPAAPASVPKIEVWTPKSGKRADGDAPRPTLFPPGVVAFVANRCSAEQRNAAAAAATTVPAFDAETDVAAVADIVIAALRR